MKLRRSKKGFTIVELVIVVGVIGILSAVLIPTFVNLTATAKANALQLELRNAYSAYAADAADGFVGEANTQAHELKAQADIALSKVNPLSSNKAFVWTGSKYEEKTLTGGTVVIAEAYNNYYAFTFTSYAA